MIKIKQLLVESSVPSDVKRDIDYLRKQHPRSSYTEDFIGKVENLYLNYI